MALDESDKKRIAGRQWAEEAIEYAIDQGPHFLIGFSRAIRKFQHREEELAPPYQMTEDEAIAFEKKVIEWGKHKGETWGEVDTGYIVWLAESGRPLQEYCRSDRFQRRQDEDLDDD